MRKIDSLPYGDRPKAGLQVAVWKPSVAHDKPVAVMVSLSGVPLDVLFDFELQGHPEHLLGSMTGDLFEFAAADGAGQNRQEGPAPAILG